LQLASAIARQQSETADLRVYFMSGSLACDKVVCF
jgi:hypothetical protein